MKLKSNNFIETNILSIMFLVFNLINILTFKNNISILLFFLYIGISDWKKFEIKYFDLISLVLLLYYFGKESYFSSSLSFTIISIIVLYIIIELSFDKEIFPFGLSDLLFFFINFTLFTSFFFNNIKRENPLAVIIIFLLSLVIVIFNTVLKIKKVNKLKTPVLTLYLPLIVILFF